MQLNVKKYFYLKIFYTRKIIYMLPNVALNPPILLNLIYRPRPDTKKYIYIYIYVNKFGDTMEMV